MKSPDNPFPTIVRFVIYNYHASGGTFGKSIEVIEGRRKQRVEELRALNADIVKELTSSCLNVSSDNLSDGIEANKKILIGGDFNADGNDQVNFPETIGFPENVLNGRSLNEFSLNDTSEENIMRLQNEECKKTAANKNILVDPGTTSELPNQSRFNNFEQTVGNTKSKVLKCYDAWTKVHGNANGSATESHIHNKFRAWLKPKQNREATFDRIVVASLVSDGFDEQPVEAEPVSIELIGNKKVETISIDDKQDGSGIKTEVEVYPSDHFGLKCRLQFNV